VRRGDGGLLNDFKQFLNEGAIHKSPAGGGSGGAEARTGRPAAAGLFRFLAVATVSAPHGANGISTPWGG
jgi:hypothetical protein